jgi:hypothetical protein
VLIPVEQASVPFYGHELVAVRLADGRIAAVLRWMCDGMTLEFTAQMQRIRRKTALRDELLLVQVETDGGPQPMLSLTLRGLPGWLYSIDETRVSEASRQAVIHFQRECTDVLAEHFAKRQPQLTPPPSLVPSEPITRPTSPEIDAPPDEWLEFHKQMIVWLEWKRDMQQWRGWVERRLDEHEQVLRLVPEIMERLGPATLSPEHQRSIQAGVNRLQELTGRPHAAIYNDLREAFRVGTYKDIAEARWEEVAVWLSKRVARAGGGTDMPPAQGSLL